MSKFKFDRAKLPCNNLIKLDDKVDVQPWLGNNVSNFGQNLNHQTSYIYKSAGGWQAGGWVGRTMGERSQARQGSSTT